MSSAFYLWINGQRVGYSQDSFSPAEFDITRYITKGENLVAVEVYRWSDGSYLEDQDMWRLSGIFRNVFIYSVPLVHLRDYYVLTDLDENYLNADLKCKLLVVNASDEPIYNFTLQFYLLDQTDKNFY